MSEGGGAVSARLSQESLPVFREGICLTLSRWSALQLAVENEWGGRGSRRISDQLVADILSWFTQSKEPLYIDDLENILDEAMISLNTMAEDGSIEEVAEKLMIMHEECLEGNFKSIEKLREAGTQRVAHNHVRQAANDDDEDSDYDDAMEDDGRSNMMVDAPQSRSNSNAVTMPVDEPRPKEEAQSADGWVVVSSKRNRGKRN